MRSAANARGAGRSPGRTGSLSLLTAALVLGGVGPYLVLRDRWFEKGIHTELFSFYSDRFPFLWNFNLPTYALALAAGQLLLVILFFFRRRDGQADWKRDCAFSRRGRALRTGRTQRRIGSGLQILAAAAILWLAFRAVVLHRLPGVELAAALAAFAVGAVLRELAPAAAARLWRKKWVNVVSIVAAHAFLLAWLASHFSTGRFETPLAVAAVLASAVLCFRIRRTGPVPLIILVAVVFYVWRITAWNYALIGDEYIDWSHSSRIAGADPSSYVLSHLFLMEGGILGVIPYFGSLLQAAIMKIVGINLFGWRFACLYLSAISLGFYVRFARTFLARRTAVAATILLGSSHYVMTFGKIGYTLLQAYVAMSVVLAAASWAVRTRRAMAFTVLGLAMAFCFYVYPAALYALPLALLAIAIFAPPFSKRTFGLWATTAFVSLATIFPLPLQPTYITSKRAGTIWYNPEIVKSTATIVTHFVQNLIYAFSSPAIIPMESHFVTVSYVDALTATFLAIGLALVVWLTLRDRFAAFLIIGFGFLLFFVGASHDRQYPPTTRMFMMLPWWALFASIGLARLQTWTRTGLSRVAGSVFFAAALAAAVAANLYQAYVVSPRRSTGYEGGEVLVVRLEQSIQKRSPAPAKKLLILTDSSWNAEGLRGLVGTYGLLADEAHFDQIEVSAPTLAESARAAIRPDPVLVVVWPGMREDWRQPIEQELVTLGKVPCPVRTTIGEVRFKLWESPTLPRLCD
ncbi:MAG TPA: hypothetical protein VJA66_16145 [Thermoanaerobaculia bacterium]